MKGFQCFGYSKYSLPRCVYFTLTYSRRHKCCPSNFSCNSSVHLVSLFCLCDVSNLVVCVIFACFVFLPYFGCVCVCVFAIVAKIIFSKIFFLPSLALTHTLSRDSLTKNHVLIPWFDRTTFSLLSDGKSINQKSQMTQS